MIILTNQLSIPENATIQRSCMYFEKQISVVLDDINCWIAGGCFRSYFSIDEKIQDIDIFFISKNEAAKAVKKLRKIGFKHFFINKNAIKGFIQKNDKKIYIDIVKRFYNSPEESLIDFDFSVCKFAYMPKNKTFYYSSMAFADLATKRLVIPDENYGNPLGSLKRLQKYIKKGYTACNGTLITLAKNLNKIDLNNPSSNDIEFYPDGRHKIILFD